MTYRTRIRIATLDYFELAAKARAGEVSTYSVASLCASCQQRRLSAANFTLS